MCATALATAMDGPILLILTGEDCKDAIEAAFNYAQLTSKRLCVLQILTSNLYHYGHHDLITTRPTKRQFLLYIRDEVLKRGETEVQALEKKAGDMGISLEVNTVESEDIFLTSLSEAKKGYDSVFLPKGKKKLFPLFKKNLAQYLQKKVSGKIVPC